MEVEKLKQLFFDKNQYFIFQHLPKPILFDSQIYKKNPRKRFSKITKISHMEGFWRRRANQKYNRTLYEEAYEKIKQKECLDLIDNRLIGMLEGFS